MAEVLATSWPILAVLAGLLAASAFFSASETAVFNLGDADLRTGAGAARGVLRRLLARRESLLVTILLGNLVVNITWFNLASVMASRFSAADAGGLAAATPLLALALVILLGEVGPKVAAMRSSRRIAVAAAAPLLAVEWILLPVRVVLSGITVLLTRLLVGARRAEGDLTNQELADLLRLAAREGHIAPDESERLQAVVALSRTEVREIMVPRVSVVGLPVDASRDQLLEAVAAHRHNKLPVYRGSLDRIEGFVDAKEALAAPDTPLASLVRPVNVVPESTPVGQVIERFLRDRVRVMVVVDEYGGTEGILTHEDLVEAVVGDLGDEGEDATPDVIHLGPAHYSVDAGMSVASWSRLVGRAPQDLGVTTVGGLVTALLARLPKPGDQVRLGRLVLEVLSMKGRRPDRVLVRLAPREGPAP